MGSSPSLSCNVTWTDVSQCHLTHNFFLCCLWTHLYLYPRIAPKVEHSPYSAAHWPCSHKAALGNRHLLEIWKIDYPGERTELQDCSPEISLFLKVFPNFLQTRALVSDQITWFSFCLSPLFFLIPKFLIYFFFASPCGILVPQLGTEPKPLQWKRGILTTGLPVNSSWIFVQFLGRAI